MLPEIINFKSPSAGRDLAGKDPTSIPACRMQVGVMSALTLDGDIGNLVPAMGMNVQVVLLTPLLMSAGILIWAFTLG